LFLILLAFGLSKGLNLFLNLIPININLILHSIELAIPPPGNILLLDNTLKGIFPNPGIILLIPIASNGPSHTPLKILHLIRHKIEPISLLSFGIKLKNRVLQATCPKRDDWRTAAEELMLDDSSGLEEGGHEGEVTADVHEGTVGEEQVGVAPDALGVLLGQVFHSLRAVFPVLLF
jgi:hypothetical protein